jgi:hypothetical protein
MNRRSLWIESFALLLISSLVLCQAQENSQISQISDGEISDNTYHNGQLAFSYQFPAGWTVGKATVPEHKFGLKDNPGEKSSPKETRRCSKQLLFVTEHPEGMRPHGFVPMASLFVVDPSCMPSAAFPSSVGDREAVERVVKGIEARLDTPPVGNGTPPRVRPVEYAGRVVIQISQSISVSVHDADTTTDESLQMSVSVMQAREYWVIWLFVTANDSEMNKLKATRIFFDGSPPPATGANKQ